MSEAYPEYSVSPDLRHSIGEASIGLGSVDDAEVAALRSELLGDLNGQSEWASFTTFLESAVASRGFAVIRGLPADGGRSLLIASAALRLPFDTYAAGRIVKRFRMSPWTTELSHTTRAGDFHTDGNVSVNPPVATAIQCEVEDPGAPEYAEQRVAYLPDLLARLANGNRQDADALAFLRQGNTLMAHERKADVWCGSLVRDGVIRYHPHSLRIACRRSAPHDAAVLESFLESIHRAAIEVSTPFQTSVGDTLIVSNRTALHYRGACSVRFTRYPTDFESRSVLVLHLKGAPTT
jgi:hypothetical protein